MSRHTTFRYCLDPTTEQQEAMARHCGASRFAFNQCLRMVKTNLRQRKTDPAVKVPWSGFDLINRFNAWKKSEDAGRVFTVDTEGVAEIAVTGLAWRNRVYQQVFEEAAVDLAGGLAAWSDSRSGKRRGKRVGFPQFKKKSANSPSFRLRNKHDKGHPPGIRLGDNGRPRSVTLPGLGQVRVHDDTRRLRRMLANGRARVCFATVSHHGGRWWIALNVQAAELHPKQQHPTLIDPDSAGWVGVDRGLSTFLVAATADGTEVARIVAPKVLAVGMNRQRRLAKSFSRKKKGSRNRKDAAAQLARHHRHVADTRRHFLHQVANEVVKTHDRLVIEDLNVAGMLGNRRLARAISDAGWTEFARLLKYKQSWRGGHVVEADRWYPSTRQCSQCGEVDHTLTLAERVFTCGCGHAVDRDTNAATNLARWGLTHHGLHRPPDPQAGGRANNAHRRDGADQNPLCPGGTNPDEVGTDVRTATSGKHRRRPRRAVAQLNISVGHASATQSHIDQ
ncbi:RNA-guided endonuclease InsQ/TnpB family protein [Mycolicibacterium peregrinum]|uniref:RNA-guided endonuclease InsQ/TnpB family protein n=1 Tax=Mycolicibacterium peregrinum TaxID=43304 RepID=UPI003AADD445